MLWRFALHVTAHPTNLLLTTLQRCSDYAQQSKSKLEETATWMQQIVIRTGCSETSRIARRTQRESKNGKGCV
jgi:hypothetical protein